MTFCGSGHDEDLDNLIVKQILLEMQALDVCQHKGEKTMNPSQEFKPGEIVPVSGIYTVKHDRGHTAPHQVTCTKGERFPPCRYCQHGVRFVLTTRTIHLYEDHWLDTPPTEPYLTSPEDQQPSGSGHPAGRPTRKRPSRWRRGTCWPSTPTGCRRPGRRGRTC